MDDDEEEDNLHTDKKKSVLVTLVIVKSNMVKQPSRQRIIHSRQQKLGDKFSLLLFALLFSDFQLWFTCAQNINQLNVSRFRSLAELGQYRRVSNPSSSILDRRLRHDTVKSAANKRLISFEPVSNLVFDYKHNDSAHNTSIQYLQDESFKNSFADRRFLERSTTERSSITTAGKVSHTKYNESCSCFGGKKKVSRDFSNMTISLQHRVLNTSAGITRGIVYQGKALVLINHFFM